METWNPLRLDSMIGAWVSRRQAGMTFLFTTEDGNDVYRDVIIRWVHYCYKDALLLTFRTAMCDGLKTCPCNKEYKITTALCAS